MTSCASLGAQPTALLGSHQCLDSFNLQTSNFSRCAAQSPQHELQHWVCTPAPMSFHCCRDTKKYRFLFVSQTAILRYDLSPMEGVVITARDGLELPAYLSLPVGK